MKSTKPQKKNWILGLAAFSLIGSIQAWAGLTGEGRSSLWMNSAVANTAEPVSYVGWLDCKDSTFMKEDGEKFRIEDTKKTVATTCAKDDLDEKVRIEGHRMKNDRRVIQLASFEVLAHSESKPGKEEETRDTSESRGSMFHQEWRGERYTR